MMKIAWFCIPAHGHTNPTLGLVKEMVDAGHEVTYFSFEQFRDEIEDTGAVFVSCDDCNLDIDAEDGGNRVGKDLAFSIELIVESALSMDALTERVILQMKPDLIVTDSMAFYGKLTALKYGIPYVCSTTTFAFNQYSARYMKQGIGGLLSTVKALPKIHKQIKRLRKKGYPVKNFLDLISNDNKTNTIVYTSKEFQPCSETFSDRYHFIGPSIRPVKTPMEKTAKKTVYISMGTVVSNKEIYIRSVKALLDSDYQVIVSMGETKGRFKNLPDNIKVYPSVDQMAVLKIADVFVTHCGMNSVSEALWHEVPLVLVPRTPEQEAVARRTEELGAGIMLPESKRRVGEIRAAIDKVLNDESYKTAAAAISGSFKKCGGVKEDRAFLESVAKGS